MVKNKKWSRRRNGQKDKFTFGPIECFGAVVPQPHDKRQVRVVVAVGGESRSGGGRPHEVFCEKRWKNFSQSIWGLNGKTVLVHRMNNQKELLTVQRKGFGTKIFVRRAQLLG